ncbi:hypothetical protein VNO78_20615 [Psophocarpus tetragonolobus]|uniref:Myb-like domain-containing protein n=1 Tax=Psophocarpus tetragonolobus TaxID=3891 RepID=A0AAN9XHA9_PSOTE
MSDMDVFSNGLCGWSWKENKLFEVALSMVEENHPDRWKVVAAMVGGQKRAEDVQKHFVFLLEDLNLIESGKLDHKMGMREAHSCVLVDFSESLCLSDRDISISIHALPVPLLCPVSKSLSITSTFNLVDIKQHLILRKVILL